MILKKEQIDEMQEAAKPLVKWLNDNCHPHCKVIVENDRAEIVEGSAMVKITEFIKN